MGRGILVVFEGIDGAGKSTQVRRLTQTLRGLGVPLRVDREPTDGPHGRRLRASATQGRLTAEEELELFILDRKEHVDGFIEPGLAAGEVVILDRYYFSNAAYQGSRGLDWREILRRNEAFAPAPDVLIWLDLSIDASSERIQVRGEGGTEFEKRSVLERCSEIYAQIQHPALRRIDARRPVDLVARACLAEVQLALVQRLVGESRLDVAELLAWVRRWTLSAD
jgi:dTMP kinase